MKNVRKELLSVALSVVFIICLVISPMTLLNSKAANETQMTDMAWQVLDIVNREREANGLQPVTMDKGFMNSAQIRGVEIVSVFSHTRPDGSSCFTIFPKENQTSMGENIAAGQRSAEKVMDAWMNSPGHRANILNGSYNAIGIACVYAPDSSYGYYWVQCFGSTVNEGITKNNIPVSPVITEEGTVAMYRVYNPNSAEHFYTSNYNELVTIGNLGWQYEGVAWVAPENSNIPVYRLYSQATGDHHYTVNASEKDMLVSVGWGYEGVGWYANESGTPLYRLFNPNATGAGSHHYTSSSAERDNLVSAGWRDEGIGWYGL
ncbi:MAG: hypothetical protein K5644_04620 [Lachnospiraceae bacterium]|nr:hypothetical protein [Lachnospiraceae bacterium]